MQTEHVREGADLDDFLEALRRDVNPIGVPGVPYVEGWVPPATAALDRMLQSRKRRLRTLAGGCEAPNAPAETSVAALDASSSQETQLRAAGGGAQEPSQDTNPLRRTQVGTLKLLPYMTYCFDVMSACAAMPASHGRRGYRHNLCHRQRRWLNTGAQWRQQSQDVCFCVESSTFRCGRSWRKTCSKHSMGRRASLRKLPDPCICTCSRHLRCLCALLASHTRRCSAGSSRMQRLTVCPASGTRQTQTPSRVTQMTMALRPMRRQASAVSAGSAAPQSTAHSAAR